MTDKGVVANLLQRILNCECGCINFTHEIEEVIDSLKVRVEAEEMPLCPDCNSNKKVEVHSYLCPCSNVPFEEYQSPSSKDKDHA